MGFFKNITRGVTAALTGGLSEFAQKDSFGVPNAQQYMLPIGATAAGAMFGNPALGAQMGMGLYSGQQASAAQRTANEQNIAIAREQMAFSAQQAQNQMDFQERMANTAHQRQVKDLQAAGLNPLLALNSGADSPGGASGSSAGATMAPVPPMIQGAMASAMETRRFQKEMKLLDEQINNAKETGYNTRENTERVFEDRRGLKLENDFILKRNKFFEDHPNMFKLHVAAGGVNSASSMLRLLK